jgi:hypothetical protein
MQLERLGVRDEEDNIVQSPNKVNQEESPNLTSLLTKKEEEKEEAN